MYQAGAAITPHDTNELATTPTRAIYVGGAGAIAAVLVDGNAVTFAGLLAGSVLPVQARIVKSTGTTATSLVALY